MNGDLQELMTHISGLHNEQMKALGDLNTKFAEHKGVIETRVGVVEGAIAEAKEDKKETERRQWYHSLVVTGITMLKHSASVHFGWRF